MKTKIKILPFIIFLTCTTIFGQTNDICDTIFDHVDKLPKFNNDNLDLSNYIINELAPIVSNCMKRDGNLIASLSIILTINSQGKVIDATFSRPKLTDQCKNELRNKLLTMTGWTAGQLNDRNVCFYYHLPISCFQWQ